MRSTQTEALPELVTIKRMVVASDGFGGYAESSLTTVASDVPARITEAQLQTMPGQAARDLLIEKWTLRLPHGTDLQDEDLVIWGATTFKVENVKGRSWDTAVTATAEVVR